MDRCSCSLHHPIYEILGNETRRNILRLIACEQNYGNRLAQILNISSQAVHRHIKYLLDPKHERLSVLTEARKTKNSFSGHKGAEATIYEINKKIMVIFSIYPNFVQSHVYVNPEPDTQSILTNPISKDVFNNIKILDKDSSLPVNEEYKNLIHEIQEINKKVIKKERELKELMEQKNILMGELSEKMKDKDLSFKEKTLLKAFICQGHQCLPELSKIFGDKEDTLNYALVNLLNITKILPTKPAPHSSSEELNESKQ